MHSVVATLTGIYILLRCISCFITDLVLPVRVSMDLGLSPLPLSLMTFTNSYLMRSMYFLPFVKPSAHVRSYRWVWRKWNGPKQLEDKKTKSLMMLPYVPLSIHLSMSAKHSLEPTTFLPRTRVSRSTQRPTLMTLNCSSTSSSSFISAFNH